MKNSQTEVLIQNSRVKKEISEKSPKRTSQIQSKFTQAGVHTLLGAGGFLALAGGFPGIALGCYVGKTAFGGFQGYKLGTRIYDIGNQRIQKIYAPKNPPKTTPKLRKIIGAVGVAVMLVLGGSHIASASAETVLDTLPGKSDISYTPPEVPEISKTSAEVLGNIQKSCETMHPNEPLSLERCYRRLVAIEQNRDIFKSEDIASLNQSVAREIREPNSRIIEIMKQCGMLQEGEDFDCVARKLKKEEILRILEIALEGENPQKSLEGISQNIPKESIPTVQEEIPGKNPLLPILAAAGISGIALGGYLFQKRKRGKENSKNTPHPPREMPEKSNPEVVEKSSPSPENIEKEEVGEKQKEIQNFLEDEGFCLLSPDGEFQKIIPAGKELLRFDSNTGFWELEWNGKNGENILCREQSQEGKSFFKIFERILENLFQEREKRYQIALDQVTQVQVTKKDLELMLGQLSHPKVRGNSIETGGFWFLSGENVQGTTLRYSGCELPDFSIQQNSSGSFELNSQGGAHFFDFNKRKYLEMMYGRQEAKRIIEKIIEGIQREGKIGFTGTMEAYNWHKHPFPSLYYPSSGDTGQEGAQKEFQNSNLTTKYWGIIVDCTNESHFSPPKHGQLIFDPIHKRTYCLSFWKFQKEKQKLLPLPLEVVE